MALAPRYRNKLWSTAQTTGTPEDKQTSRRQIQDVFSSMGSKAISTIKCQILENSEIFENQILHTASKS